ncbi:MAG: MFS transporter, partial [Pseudolabrys sp.]
MSALAGTASRTGGMSKDEKFVIFASSLGTIFEWYDFYLYAVLAPFFASLFFPTGNDTAALLSAFATYAAGFLVRPFGAIIFGRIGDLVGRKYTFLVTIMVMGTSTFLVGVLPTYASVGWLAPIMLVTLRLCQGLALGGEYGGAATYVAEHSRPHERGYATSFIQTTATLGLLLALIIIALCRSNMVAKDFSEWGWRVPFLVSFLMVAIAIYIRLQLQETPIFEEIKAKGQMTKNPWKEAFLSSNIKFILIATVVLIGQGVVWYSGQFWALYYLQQVSKVSPLDSAYIVGTALLIATPTLILYGWLSDKIGRKPVILGGMFLAAITYYPLYSWLGTFTQPGKVEFWPAVGIIAILVSFVGMVYGPVGAFLAEFFPGRIRYTSVSVPYHIGNGWGGGLVPFITSAAFAATGSLAYALLYCIAVPAVCFI